MKDHYEVVVVGSGYGGAIAASRFARAGRKVALLERGREFEPGDFPNAKIKALREVQVDSPSTRIGSASNLYDFRVNKDINVFQGSGLGGTSLVNANVSLRAEARVLEDPRWPRAFRDDLQGPVKEAYQRAEEMLRPTPYPAAHPPLLKLAAMEKASESTRDRFYRPPINVTFKDGVNHVGVWQNACRLCGDCVTGCNHSAKNTVAMNYLPDAKNYGAEIFTEVEVRSLERTGSGWIVYFRAVGKGQEAFNAPELFITADLVALGAGCLGSTEILLRSRARGLPLSDKLGHGFTGNGDVLAFAYNNEHPIHGTGWGWRSLDHKEPVGPCITSIIDLRENSNLEEGLVIEEGAIPGALSTFVPAALSVAAGVLGKGTGSGIGHYLREKGRALRSILGGSYSGAARNTLTLLVMAHDDGGGRLHLEHDRLRIDWPGVGEQAVFESISRQLEKLTQKLGGTYLKNPIWSRLLHHHLITVHPLGGCCMAEDASRGVVNHQGQVFSGVQGDHAYDNLLVCDGSVVPRSLGVNPLLTISAIAERSVQRVARDRGWTISYASTRLQQRTRPARRPGLQFTESMKGFFAKGSSEDFASAHDRGRKEGSPFEFTLTVATEDLGAMLRDREHRARLMGTVTAPQLSPHPLTATEGEFRLFSRFPRQVATLWMHYRMKLSTREGHRYFFEGYKRIHDDPGMDLWADTTTLYITLHEGDGPQGAVVGRGILRIRLRDFVKQMWTFKILKAPNLFRYGLASLRFYWFFTKNLLYVFGGPLARRLLGRRYRPGRRPVPPDPSHP